MAMIASKDDYVHLIKNLLPPGLAFPRDDTTSPVAQVIDVLAEECQALDTTACQLFVESTPATADESFDEWLEDWGLPDACVEAFSEQEITRDELRRELIIKSSRVGGQSIAFFKELCEMLGRDVEIRELRQQGLPDTYFRWLVEVRGEYTYREATVFMKVTEPLASFGDTLLQCLVRRYAPAHTQVSFNYIPTNRG